MSRSSLKIKTAKSVAVLLILCSTAGCDSRVPQKTKQHSTSDNGIKSVAINTLASLSVDELRSRSYGSEIVIEQRLGSRKDDSDYTREYSEDGTAPYDTFMVSYQSDGLQLYSRLDFPNQPMPESGFPVVVFLHGWIGLENAPTMNFSYAPDAYYGPTIDTFVDAGFAVLAPGYRGHGTVNGKPADGIEYLEYWDNGSYLSPIFYAVDVLNLLDSLESLSVAGKDTSESSIDTSRIFLASHSQGGDVALMVLAISGEDSMLRNAVKGASIWAGTFAPRLTQLETYYPMQVTPQAFLSGDGTWNGTALGADNSVNPDFVFGYPPEWIVTVNPEEWTWQKKTWAVPTVSEALTTKLEELYGTINALTLDLGDAAYSLQQNADGRTIVQHDSRVLDAMHAIDAYHFAEYLQEPLLLHHSDQDFYSLPEWNSDLCSRINSEGGQCEDHTYTENTHMLNLSKHSWFSNPGSRAGFDNAMQRDIALFTKLSRNTSFQP